MRLFYCILLTMAYLSDNPGFAQHEKILRGTVQVNEILSGPERIWFGKNYDEYQPDMQLCRLLAEKTIGHRWVVFAGSWCEDTQKLLPLLYKVTDAANISHRTIELVFLDRQKTSPEGLENKYNVSRLPTFILLKGDQEVGRIIESIGGRMEDELLKLL